MSVISYVDVHSLAQKRSGMEPNEMQKDITHTLLCTKKKARFNSHLIYAM